MRKCDLVSEGQELKDGRTGKVKGAHLHYEISVNGSPKNLPLISKLKKPIKQNKFENFATKLRIP